MDAKGLLYGLLAAVAAFPGALLVAVAGQGIGALLGGCGWIGVSTPVDRQVWALVNQPTGLAGWQGPYLKRGTPKDPWGNPYLYRSPGQHNASGCDLYSMGPDGQDGGSDDIDNWSER